LELKWTGEGNAMNILHNHKNSVPHKNPMNPNDESNLSYCTKALPYLRCILSKYSTPKIRATSETMEHVTA